MRDGESSILVGIALTENTGIAAPHPLKDSHRQKMSSQSCLSRRNFKISTLDEIFSHFGPLCGGGTAQERTATGRRGSKHGWVVTPATVGRQPSQRDPSPADRPAAGLAATLGPRRGNGEPRRLSRFVAFFHPTILVTRRRDHFVGASARLATTSRPALTATRARATLLPDWMLLSQKVSSLFEKVTTI